MFNWQLGAILALTVVALCLLAWPPGFLEFQVGGRSLFLSFSSELLVLCALVLITVLVGVKIWRGAPRVWLAAGAIAAVWIYVLLHLYPTQPEKVALSELKVPVQNDRKVLLIGIDALTWNRLLPLVRQGTLPHIERLMEEGSYAVLHSYKTYRARVRKWGFWSPVVWTTIATGVRVEKHGIDDFSIARRAEKPAKKKRRVTANAQHRRAPAFWNIYSSLGKSVGVVGWWASWPAEEVRGVLVSSNVGLRGRRRVGGRRRVDNLNLGDSAWYAERERLSYPEDYMRTVTEEIGLPDDTEAFINQQIFPFDRYPLLPDRDWDSLRKVFWQDRLYHRITEHLLRREDLAIYTTYLEGVDAVGHKFWKYMAYPDRAPPIPLPEDFDLHRRIVDRYYAVVDSYIGSLLEAAGKDMTVVICSDHGFQTTPEGESPAGHSGSGVLILKGPGIRKNGNHLSLTGAAYDLVNDVVRVEDVLPTLLYMQGLPISEELDGGVADRFFERSYLTRHPEIRTPTYGDFSAQQAEIEPSAEDEEEYLERLRSLGYIN